MRPMKASSSGGDKVGRTGEQAPGMARPEADEGPLGVGVRCPAVETLDAERDASRFEIPQGVWVSATTRPVAIAVTRAWWSTSFWSA